MILAVQKETLHVSNISDYCLSKDDENDGGLILGNSSRRTDGFMVADPAAVEVAKGQAIAISTNVCRSVFP